MKQLLARGSYAATGEIFSSKKFGGTTANGPRNLHCVEAARGPPVKIGASLAPRVYQSKDLAHW